MTKECKCGLIVSSFWMNVDKISDRLSAKVVPDVTIENTLKEDIPQLKENCKGIDTKEIEDRLKTIKELAEKNKFSNAQVELGKLMAETTISLGACATTAKKDCLVMK